MTRWARFRVALGWSLFCLLARAHARLLRLTIVADRLMGPGELRRRLADGSWLERSPYNRPPLDYPDDDERVA